MTRDELQSRLDAYLAAELRILKSQEYTVGDGGEARRNKRAELTAVQAEIAQIRRELAALDRAEAMRTRYGGRSGGIVYARPAR